MSGKPFHKSWFGFAVFAAFFGAIGWYVWDTSKLIAVMDEGKAATLAMVERLSQDWRLETLEALGTPDVFADLGRERSRQRLLELSTLGRHQSWPEQVCSVRTEANVVTAPRATVTCDLLGEFEHGRAALRAVATFDQDQDRWALQTLTVEAPDVTTLIEREA